jgi:rhodanese-related sulfurtransferase
MLFSIPIPDVQMINIKKTRIGLLLPVLSALSMTPGMSGCSTKISDSVVNRITTTEAIRRHDGEKTLFIDARPKSAYQRGHIAGAISLRLGELSYTDRDTRLMTHSPLVVYGENPGSAPALALAKRLLEMDYKDIEYYEPGLSGWRAAGLPIERAED